MEVVLRMKVASGDNRGQWAWVGFLKWPEVGIQEFEGSLMRAMVVFSEHPLQKFV